MHCTLYNVWISIFFYAHVHLALSLRGGSYVTGAHRCLGSIEVERNDPAVDKYSVRGKGVVAAGTVAALNEARHRSANRVRLLCSLQPTVLILVA